MNTFEIEFAEKLFPGIWQLGMTGIKTLRRGRFLLDATKRGRLFSIAPGSKIRLVRVTTSKSSKRTKVVTKVMARATAVAA